MACKKSELVSAINSYANARMTGDANLQKFSAELLQQAIDSLDFDAEEDAGEQAEAAA